MCQVMRTMNKRKTNLLLPTEIAKLDIIKSNVQINCKKLQ